MTPEDLKKRIGTAAFAFRGYNITNLGKTPELLEHPRFGPVLEASLERGSEVCARAVGRPVDLVRQVRNREEYPLERYPEALTLIVSVEQAQLKILRDEFGIELAHAQMMFGYSLGEVSALIASGVFSLEEGLTPVLVLGEAAAELAQEITLGVLFSRGPALDLKKVKQRCLEITAEGNGMIAISTYLAPNSVLLMGQGETVDRFKATMTSLSSGRLHVHKNPHRWPPIHTPITWQKCIPNQAGLMLAQSKTGFGKPSPLLLSCVTGNAVYDDINAREVMTRWVDHPQRLWDVIDRSLKEGVEIVVHMGPEPNIIPATYSRLSNNVLTQLNARSLAGMGLRAISRIVRRRRPWLQNLLSSDATLLRAPFVEHILLEDWLLAQPTKVSSPASPV